MPIRVGSPATALEFVETYFSRVFLTPTDVWKIKKPVRLGAVELSTVAHRREACEAEVRLNRRLAPDVYRGVVPVTKGQDGRHRIGGDGPAVDWAVHMTRLSDSDRADARLREGRLGDEEVRLVARHLAALHERARSDVQTMCEGSLEVLRERVCMQIGEPSAPRAGGLDAPLPPEAAKAEAWQLGFLQEHAERFEARAAAGFVRDGHGELALEHVFVDEEGRVNVIDCLAFDDRLRFEDVCADAALLCTDLASEGRADLAERFLAEYAGVANDFDLYPLVDFYSSLRACLRGKLEWFYADHFRHDPHSAEERRERARRFFLLSLAAPRQPILPPVVVAMGGQVASGKSTLARHIAREIGAPVVSSDRTRDFLLGGGVDEDRHEARWERSYEPGFGDCVYKEAMGRAGEVLRSGRPVVLDGCFRSAEQRGRARGLAARFDRPFLFVEAFVSETLQRERLRERSLRDSEPEATWTQIAADLRAQWQTASEIPEVERIVLDTALPLERNVEQLRAHLPVWPEGLKG